MLGYFAIYLIGTDTGLVVLPPDPYYAYRNEQKKEKAESKAPQAGKMLTVLAGMSASWWIAYGMITMGWPFQLPVSRQMVRCASTVAEPR